MSDNVLKEILIEVTRSCPLGCKHCSTYDPSLKIVNMPVDKAKSIIREFKNLGGEKLHVSGGEPLLYSDLFEVLSYARRMDIPDIRIFTCGVLPSKTKIKKILKKLADIEVSKIGVSLHGPNDEIHNSVTRKNNSFTKTLTFIREAKSLGIPVKINFVPMAVNVNEFREMVKWCLDILEVEEISILRFVPQGRGVIYREELELNKEMFGDLVSLISELCSIYPESRISPGTPIDFRFLFDSRFADKTLTKRCTAGVTECMIRVDGSVLPCPAFLDLPNYIAGNVYQSTLAEIWHKSSILHKFREFYQNYKGLIKGLCKSCQYLEICGGRCPSHRIREHRDLTIGPDPYCPLVAKG